MVKGGSLLVMIIGATIGIHRALKVEMTEMPELVAILHSFAWVGSSLSQVLIVLVYTILLHLLLLMELVEK